jgi:hypothetical protein
MSGSVVVRYRTKPEAAQENARLIQAVFAELAELGPSDLRYTAYRLADGVTFVHAATVNGDKNPLATLPAFAEFQREIAQRCEEPPAASDASIVGSYG